jgi:hypothetical protein
MNRQHEKLIRLGQSYGMGGPAMARALERSRPVKNKGLKLWFAFCAVVGIASTAFVIWAVFTITTAAIEQLDKRFPVIEKGDK